MHYDDRCGGWGFRLMWAMLGKKWAESALVISSLLLGLLGLSFAQERTASPARELDLRVLGFKLPADTPQGTVGHPAVLFDDSRARVVFVDPRQLAVYFSDGVSDRPAAQMEAFFVDTDTSKLVSHEVWHTRKRRFFNERYDTQARIIPIAHGFLVHTDNSMRVYSASHDKVTANAVLTAKSSGATPNLSRDNVSPRRITTHEARSACFYRASITGDSDRTFGNDRCFPERFTKAASYIADAVQGNCDCQVAVGAGFGTEMYDMATGACR
jgi:hypothetical protein